MSLNVEKFREEIQGEILTAETDLQKVEINGGYVSDLLSDVMGNSAAGDAWITIMRHLNVIAVASMIGLPAIVFAKGIKPEANVIAKAKEENICLISSPLSTFKIAGKLYNFLNT